MVIYIAGFVLTLILSYISIKNKSNKKIYILFAVLSAIPLFLISALRYGVGTDYFYRYVPDFVHLSKGNDVSNLELGFKLFEKFLMIFSKSYNILFITTSALIIFPIFYLIYKKSKYPVVSILLFIIGAFYFESLNLIRQYLAMTIILCSYPLLVDKKVFKWLLCVLLALSVHMSSIVCLVMILAVQKKFYSPIVTSIVSVTTLLLGPLIKKLMYIVVSFTPYSNYLDTIYSKTNIMESIIVLNIFVYVIMYILYKKKMESNDISKEDTFFMNVQTLAVVMCVLSIQFSIMYRLVGFFMIFQIISIPKFLNLKNKFDKRIFLMLLLVLSINFYHLYIKNNVNEVFPYRFFFDKKTYYRK